MSHDPTNRLPFLWPSQSPDGQPSPLSVAKQLAARTEQLLQGLGRAIAEHPRTSMTVAATLGALAGWFIKRK